ncbi:MAG: sporulation protein YunB [Firmicutes bacterium]|nr:sporulation protein YunB [Bacillota bacterium]
MFKRRKRHKLKAFLLLLLLLVGIFFAVFERKAVPIIFAEARNSGHSLATDIIQHSVRQKFADTVIAYDELMHIEKDNEGKIILIMPNSARINQTVSELTADIDKALQTLEQKSVYIPLGIVSGSKMLATKGPLIKVNIRPIGAVHINVKDEFTSSGINQSRHSIRLEIEVNMTIAIPFDSVSFSASSSVLLCEGIIVGPVPQTYLNFGTDGKIGEIPNKINNHQ